jgi:hypothetical protein
MADDGSSKRAKREIRQRLTKATHYLDPLYENMEVNATFDRYVYMILVSAGLKHVGREGRGHPVFLTLQPSCSLRELDDLLKGVFMSGAGRVSLEYVPVLTARAMQRSTALVVSIGERHTFVSPVIEGDLYHHGVQRSAVSSLLVTRYLYETLLDSKLPLATVRFLKEHHSKVCEDYKAEEEQWRGKLLNMRTNIGTKETVPWHALITCGEAYFRPRLVREVYQGEDSGESGPLDWENGLHKLVQLAIAKCPPQYHLELYRNILIEGEGGQFTGLVDRLRRELTRCVDLTEICVRICPRFIAWKGAAALSTSLQAKTVSREGFSKVRKNPNNFRKLLHPGAVSHYRPTQRFSSSTSASSLGGITDLATRSFQPPSMIVASSSTSPTAETATVSSSERAKSQTSCPSPSTARRFPTPLRASTLPEDLADLSIHNEAEEDEEDARNRRFNRRNSQPKTPKSASAPVEDLAAPSSSSSPHASSRPSSSSQASSSSATSTKPDTTTLLDSNGLPPPRRVVRGAAPSSKLRYGNGRRNRREEEDFHPPHAQETDTVDVADTARKFNRGGKSGTSTSPSNPMRDELLRTAAPAPSSNTDAKHRSRTPSPSALRDDFLTDSEDTREMQMPDNLDSIAELQASDLISENILSSHMLERIHRIDQGIEDASSDETSSSSNLGPLPTASSSSSPPSSYSASTARRALRSEGSRDFGDLTRTGLFDLIPPSPTVSLAANASKAFASSSSSSSTNMQVDNPPTRRVVHRVHRSASSSGERGSGRTSRDFLEGRKWRTSLTESDEASSSTSTVATSSAKLPYRKPAFPMDNDTLDDLLGISDLAPKKKKDEANIDVSHPAPPRKSKKVPSKDQTMEASSSSAPSSSSTISSVSRKTQSSSELFSKKSESIIDLAPSRGSQIETSPSPIGELRRAHSKTNTSSTSSTRAPHSAVRVISPHLDRNKDHIKAKPELPTKPNLNLNGLTTRFHVKIDVHIREYLSFVQTKLTPFVLHQLKDRDFLEGFVLPRYQKFVHLKQTCDADVAEKLIPDVFIEAAWHAHMTRPLQYRDYSVKNYGGKILGHSLREVILAHEVDKSDLDTMQKIWKKTFNGESFVKTMPTEKMIKTEIPSSNGSPTKASKRSNLSKSKGKQDSHNTTPSSSSTPSVAFKFSWKRDKTDHSKPNTKTPTLPSLDFDLAGAIIEDLDCNSTYSQSLRKNSGGAFSRKNFLHPRTLAVLLKAYEMFFYLLLKYGTKHNMVYFKPPPYLAILWRAHMLAPQFYVRDVKLYHSHLVAQASSESYHDFEKSCKALLAMGLTETPKSPGEFLRFLSELEFGGSLENVVKSCPPLPMEVLTKVFKKLPTRIDAHRLVCKHWARAANLPEVWVSHVHHDFPSLVPSIPPQPSMVRKFYLGLLHDALGGAVVFDVGAAKVKCGLAGDVSNEAAAMMMMEDDEEEESSSSGPSAGGSTGSEDGDGEGRSGTADAVPGLSKARNSSKSVIHNSSNNRLFNTGPRYVYQSGIRRAIAKRNR